MNFLDLQKDLQVLIGDTRSNWMPDETGLGTIGVSNKAAINHGIKQVFDRLKQNSLYKEQNYIEVVLNIVDNKITLPADFSIEFEIIYHMESVFDYKINKPSNSIIFDNIDSGEVTLRYLKKEVVLVGINDLPNIEEHFREAISLFAMEKYHIAQFDWDNVAKSVAYAEDKLEDLISKYF